MKPFLQLVAENLFGRFGNDISNLKLVFPNRRASLFFNSYLSKVLSKPIWQPEIVSLNDLMYSLSGLKPADALLLNFELYKCYLDVVGSNESYDSFFFWGNVMLQDFDQVDKYLVNPDKIFANIKDLKEIEQRFDELDSEHIQALKNFLNIVVGENQSEIRSRYSRIWSRLGDVYRKFRKTLLAKGIAYDGLAYRITAEKLNGTDDSTFGSIYVFIGFNALSTSEKRLFNYLQKHDKALFYWDYDLYYTRNLYVQNEASLFVNENLKQFPNSLSEECFKNFSAEKNIRLIEAPTSVSQVKLLPRILDEFGGGANASSTAVVLPDEQLLLPTLSAIPDELGSVNVTMEYPITDTSAYTLANQLISLQTNARSSNGEDRFYYADVLHILSHPYIKMVEPKLSGEIEDTITKQRLINVPETFFSDAKILKDIFKRISDVKLLCSYLSGTLTYIAEFIASETDKIQQSGKLELEYIFTVYKAVNRLSEVVLQLPDDFSKKTFRLLFQRAMREQRVSFYGKPLTGLQLMGFLETRALDFDNVVIFSMNDNVLPGITSKPSFITNSLRFAYGLPDYKHQNAIFAYYFYRLIQRAKNVFLVYTEKSDGIKSGEMSRYILQLIMESNQKVKKVDVKFDLGLTPVPEISVPKTERVLSILSKYRADNPNRGYLSPTALSTYKNCGLRFFFNSVAGIKEPDEMEETLEEKDVGTILHEVLEQLYGIDGKPVTKERLEKLGNQEELVESHLRQSFANLLNIPVERYSENITGRNALIMERIRWMVMQVLRVDVDRAPYTVVAAEKEVITEVDVNVNNENFKVMLGGKIDRIEQVENRFRIVDFKTGMTKDIKFSSVDEVFQPNPKKDAIFQILTYSLIFSKVKGVPFGLIEPNVWLIRNNNPNLKLIYDKVDLTSADSVADEFSQNLSGLIAEIFDSNISFTQTAKVDNCRSCPYNVICNRSE